MQLSITMIAIPLAVLVVLLFGFFLKKILSRVIARRRIDLKHIFWLMAVLIAIWIFSSLIMGFAMSMGHSRPPGVLLFSRLALAFSLIVLLPCAPLFLLRIYFNAKPGDIPGLKKISMLVFVSILSSIVILSLKSGLYPPLLFAMKNNFPDTAELLIRMKITLNKKDAYGSTPLQYAAIRNDTRKLKILLENGVEIGGQEGPGSKALWWACIWNNRNMAGLLIDSGVNVNVVYTLYPYEGWTPLITAASRGNFNTVKMLIEKGADPDMRDARGKTALMVAEENKQEKVALFLKGQSAGRAPP